MLRRFSILLCGFMAMFAWNLRAAVVLPLVRSTGGGADLLANGNFEQVANGRPLAWHGAPQGFELAHGEGRDASTALRCTRSTEQGWAGASQTLALNRTNAAPLRVRGWSRAEDVSGGADSGYALYVDLLYADGTSLWGQTGNFRCGTHRWEQREFLILPQQPVKSLTLHCLLRGHAGTVWFDDVSVEELGAPGGAVLFQGVAVAPRPRAAGPASAPGQVTATGDGLRLGREGDAIVSVQVGGRELASSAPGGFLLRDVATNSDFFGLSQGVCAELGMKVEADYSAEAGHIAVCGRVTDLTGTDRAVTLVFALPLEATGWQWGDDIRRSRPIAGLREYVQTVGVRCGATGTLSIYPLAPVWSRDVGLALALDMARPAVYRLGYHAGTQQLFIAYDLGLVRETERFPSGGEFRFVIYRFDPPWGFRSAWHKLTGIFPEFFRVRSREQGIWMPFTDVGTVERWEDFGFRYHEGNNAVAWDDAHGVLSFRYTEPMTWWMPMAKEVLRTPAEALRLRDELEQRGNESQRRLAEVSRRAAMFDDAGQPSLLFRNEPWCNGAIWSLNPNPDLGRTAATGAAALAPLNAATVHWNDSLKTRLYGTNLVARLDGEYLDSLEGYVTAELNFRRDHFRSTTVPLTFDTQSQRPALFKGLAVFEFTRWIAQEVHGLDRLMFANGVPYRFTFLCPWLDVMGTETDWLAQGQYRPASDVQMSLWRTSSGAKPYVLLMNTDYDAFGPEMVDQYFQRCLFYGMFPSFFSHNAAENPYWRNPRWYNRDRPLFKKYFPVIKRVAEAGWQPLTGARCDNEHVWIERFGPTGQGDTYFTLFNETAEPQSGTVVFGERGLDLDLPPPAPNVVLGPGGETVPGGWRVRLGPQQATVLAVKTRANEPGTAR